MSAHVITSLTLGGFDHLSPHARQCVFWEMDPTALHNARGFCDQEFEKEAWLSMVMLEWGSCGQVAVRDGVPLGSALYAPPRSIPRSQLFPTSPVSSDAVLLTSLRVEPVAADDGLASDLIAAVVTDLVRRGVRALEAFGIRHDSLEPANDSPTATAALECSPRTCMIDAEFLEDHGFEVVAPHHRYPRLRLELNRDHEWKVDVEEALDRLLKAASIEMVEMSELTRV
ncbi:GNAT superfamily N-acetyltransferase [Rhodococcus sp. 27YEA15]|uniref:GNAT family N-acetyltransferase n=1 Tax=Rhodococcus sp. 27YEA15 TaxID=3156259 RepID=UPI003C7E0A8E